MKVKIYGTGGVLPEGEYEVTQEIADIIVSAGRARFEREVEEIIPPKEQEKQVIDIEVKEKVEVIIPKKNKRK